MNGFFSTLAVLLVVVVLVILAFRRFNQNDTQAQLSIQAVHSNILSEMKNVKELATIRTDFQSTIFLSHNKKVFGFDLPFSERKFTLSYRGNLVCGCDLDKIKISDNFFNENHIAITLPNSRIFDIYPDVNSFQIYENKSELLADAITLELQNKAVAADIEVVKQQFISDGILIKSNENIRKVFADMTAKFGVVAEINFVDNDELPPPANQKLLQ